MRPPYRLKVGDRVRIEKAEGITRIEGNGVVERLYRGTALVLYQTQYGGTYRRFHMDTGLSIAFGGNHWLPRLRIVPIEDA